jgi:N-acetyl-alpha-D-glucosaminyl L-malate synthase BshA
VPTTTRRAEPPLTDLGQAAPMRVAMLCHASAGGSGVVATELAIALAERGVEVHLISSSRPFRLPPPKLDAPVPWWKKFLPAKTEKQTLYFHEIESLEYPLFNDSMIALTAANTVARVAQAHQIDVLHTHYAIPFATSALLARSLSSRAFKVVNTLHGSDVTILGRERALHGTTAQAVQEGDATTAVSRDLAFEAEATFTLEPDSVQVIPNWVDSKRFKPIVDPELRAKYVHSDEKLIVHVSNFREVKRPQDVVRVFAGIAKRTPARLVMVGQGPERESCMELARELDVTGRVIFQDFEPRIEKILGLADLFLLPSQLESFGLAALEAMSCGSPVVASNVGGLPEVVEHGVTGYLCPYRNVEAMVDASLEALNKPEMRVRARARAVEMFHPDLILPRYVELYRSLLVAAS